MFVIEHVEQNDGARVENSPRILGKLATVAFYPCFPDVPKENTNIFPETTLKCNAVKALSNACFLGVFFGNGNIRTASVACSVLFAQSFFSFRALFSGAKCGCKKVGAVAASDRAMRGQAAMRLICSF